MGIVPGVKNGRKVPPFLPLADQLGRKREAWALRLSGFFIGPNSALRKESTEAIFLYRNTEDPP
jgi:hypothetical protein